MGGGLDSPREEGGLAVVAANGSRACWAPSTPSWLEATRAEGGCLDRPKGGSPAARKHFDWRSLTKGPSCWDPMPRDGEELPQGGGEEGQVTP
jgi:hypothetical protein